MALIYNQTVINARLNGIVTALGATATLVLKAGGTTIATINLANPVGTVSGGVLTFTGSLTTTAVATGTVDSCVILDSTGSTAISGLSVGIPGGPQDVIISNGANSTVITSGQSVELLSAQITGS